MSKVLNDNLYIQAGKPIDTRYLNDLNAPYADVAAVNALIPLAYRFKGLTVLIGTTEYWYQSGITNGDLVIKSGGGGGTPGGSNTQVQYNNSGAFAGNAGFTFTIPIANNYRINLGTASASDIGILALGGSSGTGRVFFDNLGEINADSTLSLNSNSLEVRTASTLRLTIQNDGTWVANAPNNASFQMGSPSSGILGFDIAADQILFTSDAFYVQSVDASTAYMFLDVTSSIQFVYGPSSLTIDGTGITPQGQIIGYFTSTQTITQIQSEVDKFPFKQNVATVRTTTALPAYTVSNGGKTLTANANGAFPAVDGVTISSPALLANRIISVLVCNESTQANNGAYTLTQVGDASHPWILQRTLGFDISSGLDNARVAVDQGTLYAKKVFKQITNDPTIGSSNIVWVGPATLTNNITSGGVADTLTNWTDLTTYANDAAAIRNAIYQLGEKIKNL